MKRIFAIKSFLVTTLVMILLLNSRTSGQDFPTLAVSGAKGSPILIPRRSVVLPTRINPGAAINTRLDEVNPIIANDGKTLYFARKNSYDNVGGKYDPQDLWVSTFDSITGWTPSRNAGRQINTEGADNLTAVSSDHNTMYFYSASYSTGKFQYRTRTRYGWSSLRDLGLSIVNESRFLESWMSTNGLVLLFTARNHGNVKYSPGTEERDIYISIRLDNNQWSEPVNAGKSINTPQDEFSPFLADDNRTLYFASRGRGGYGNADIFMSRRIGDDWTSWTEPVNLGPAINSSSFDAYFRLMGDGESAYFVSHFGTAGKGDIFQVRLPEAFRPAHKENPVLVINRMHFRRGVAEIETEYFASLEEIVRLLTSDRNLVMEIHGHTDNQGSKTGLANLAKRRCQAVEKYLLAHGVQKNQIQTFSHGGNEPVAGNDNEQDRMKNRRIELRLKSSQT